MGEQDAHVLDRGDQVILDLLPPEASPARPLEVVIVSRVGKALLHELLAALAITSRPTAVGLLSRYIQECLFFVPVERAPQLRSRALPSQQTGGTDSGGRLILHRVAHRMDPPRPQPFARGTAISVAPRIVNKTVLSEDSVGLMMIRPFARIAQRWVVSPRS